MAYLNCPFCPSQAYPVKKPVEVVDRLGNPNIPVVKFYCHAGHMFYVSRKDIDGSNDERSGSCC